MDKRKKQLAQSENFQQLCNILLSMPEGDRRRVLRFAEALKDQREGKRYQRAVRHLQIEPSLEELEFLASI